jgi:hypothetical protein
VFVGLLVSYRILFVTVRVHLNVNVHVHVDVVRRYTGQGTKWYFDTLGTQLRTSFATTFSDALAACGLEPGAGLAGEA